jgi:two-component sensor histidine kinase
MEDIFRLLRSGPVQMQGIVDTLREPLIVLDQNMCVVTANPAFFRVFRADQEETLGQSLFELGNGQWDIAEFRSLLSDVVPRSAAIVGYEIAGDFPDIGQRTMLVSARRLWHPDHDSTQMLIVFEDVTERGQELAGRDMLLSETRHRMKNLLAVVRSLASQTQVEDRTGEEYRDAFLGRLEAMLSAQNILLSHIDETDIGMIIGNSLQGRDKERLVVLEGPFFRVPTAHVGPLLMILHELTTNALKHGALSNDTGKVHISWTVEPHEGQGCLALDWREEGGPRVSAPSRRGFGTDLVEFSASSMMGEAVLDYHPTGLHARLTLPAL